MEEASDAHQSAPPRHPWPWHRRRRLRYLPRRRTSLQQALCSRSSFDFSRSSSVFPFSIHFTSLHTLLYLIENLLKGIGGTERTCSRSRVPFSILYNYSNLRMIDQLSSVHCEIRSNTPGLLTTTRLIALAGESRGSPLNVWTDALHSIIT